MKNSKKCNLSKLKIDGSIVADKKIIKETVTGFVKALFNGYHDRNLENTGSSFIPDWSHLDEFLTGLGKLDDAQKTHMHRDIEEDELENVVKACQTNKSPGLDGISYELYQTMWHVLGKDLLEVFKCQLERGLEREGGWQK